MCTLTWRRDSARGLEVFFNRDELKTRPVADPPERFETGEGCFLSPRDPKGSGTWMLANDHGLVLCLLNKWELEGRQIEGARSRGRLVWSLAAARSVEEVGASLGELSCYQAFTLVGFSPGGDRCWEWDGEELRVKEVPDFLSSSSYRFEEVARAREACFRGGKEGEDLHSSRGEEFSAYTVRMNRSDAQTWSRSRVRVEEGMVRWEYVAEQPNLGGEPEGFQSELALR